MKLASNEGWPVSPAGAMTWLDAGEPLRGVNIVVSTLRLSRIIEHEPADLVAIAEAGVALNNFNNALAKNGQWLPVDPPDDGRATIGGVVATGLAGAQQFGYGAPRRHVIGMKLVLADGSLIKAGGRVVKNVAGYDLCKLFTGSYGTLGVIVEVNFKLRPIPFETRSILATGKREDLLSGARQVIDSCLFPVAVELLSPRLAYEAGWSEGKDHLLLVRFAGSLNAVDEQAKRAIEFLIDNDPRTNEQVAPDDATIWHSLAALPLRFREDLIWRVGLRPADVGPFLEKLDKARLNNNVGPMWQAGVGDGRIRLIDRLPENETTSGDIEKLFIDRVEMLRANAQSLGSALIIENAPPKVKNRVGSWGTSAPAEGLMKRIKQQLDPCDILSPGRFGF
ncbi:MAG: FAD-binding oxidoreductase [Acidobacteriota bacterium]|nr:FAD-binding oxidoreductase [Acidobacteriota bacterium]